MTQPSSIPAIRTASTATMTAAPARTTTATVTDLPSEALIAPVATSTPATPNSSAASAYTLGLDFGCGPVLGFGEYGYTGVNCQTGIVTPPFKIVDQNFILKLFWVPVSGLSNSGLTPGGQTWTSDLNGHLTGGGVSLLNQRQISDSFSLLLGATLSLQSVKTPPSDDPNSGLSGLPDLTIGGAYPIDGSTLLTSIGGNVGIQLDVPIGPVDLFGKAMATLGIMSVGDVTTGFVQFLAGIGIKFGKPAAAVQSAAPEATPTPAPRHAVPELVKKRLEEREKARADAAATEAEKQRKAEELARREAEKARKKAREEALARRREQEAKAKQNAPKPLDGFPTDDAAPAPSSTPAPSPSASPSPSPVRKPKKAAAESPPPLTGMPE